MPEMFFEDRAVDIFARDDADQFAVLNDRQAVNIVGKHESAGMEYAGIGIYRDDVAGHEFFNRLPADIFNLVLLLFLIGIYLGILQEILIEREECAKEVFFGDDADKRSVLIHDRYAAHAAFVQ